jgi:hypothetical protein
VDGAGVEARQSDGQSPEFLDVCPGHTEDKAGMSGNTETGGTVRMVGSGGFGQRAAGT